MKPCPHCGTPIHEEASFCPYCAQAVNPRSEVSIPRHMPRRALYSALLILIAAALALTAWLYTRPDVYDNGTAEVIYTDSDGSYQLLLNYFGDRFKYMIE